MARKRNSRSQSRREPQLAVERVPFPGCCRPYPHAVFRKQKLVEVYRHHNGERCGGYLEPWPLEDFNAEVAARSAGEGDDR